MYEIEGKRPRKMISIRNPFELFGSYGHLIRRTCAWPLGFNLLECVNFIRSFYSHQVDRLMEIYSPPSHYKL